MRYLLLSQWRDLISRPVATFALLLNLILALFAITVVHVASHTLVHEFAQVHPYSGYHYVVPFSNSRESSYFTLRARWRAGELPEISGMVPVVEGNLLINGRAIPLIGIDPVSDLRTSSDGNSTRAQAEFLTQDSVIVFGDDLATTVFPTPITVLEYRSGEQSFLLADIATAQNLLQRTGEIDAAWLRYDQVPAWDWLEHLSPGITTGFGFNPPDIVVPNLDIRTMENWQPTSAFAGSIAFNMGLLGMLAVLVSGFIVYETTIRSVRRRSREFDRLKTIGVSTVQIRFSLIVETIVLVFLAVVVAAVFAHMFIEQNTLIRNANTATMLVATTKGALLGLSTALVGLALALGRDVHKPHWGVLTFLLVLAAAMFYYGVWMTTTLVGAYVAIFALCVLHVLVLTPAVVQSINALVSRLSPASLISRLNLRDMWRHLRQANIGVMAFSLAIAAAIGITVMISSLRTDFFEMLANRLPPGIQIRHAGDVDPAVIKLWSGVEDVREYYRGEGNLSIGKTNVVATTLDEFEARRYGHAYDADSVGMFVNEKIAKQAKVQIGDSVSVRIAGIDPINLPVTHIFKSYGDMSRRVLVPQVQIPDGSLVRDRILLVVRPDSVASVEQQVQELYPTASVLNHQQIRDRAIAIFNRTFALTNLIALIAVIVAVIGLFNSALAMESAKRSEYRLLDTLGFSRFMLFKNSFTQAILFGCVCCMLSVPLGISIAWILCVLVNPRAFQWTINLDLSAEAIGVPIALGLSAAVFASVLPWLLVRRSSK